MNARRLYPLFYLYPALLIYLALFIFPTLFSFVYSFTDWNAYRDTIRFTGLDNFVKITKNADLMLSIGNTVLFAFVTSIGKNVLGLLLAVALCSRIGFKRLFRTVFFLPTVLSFIVVGVLFTALLHPDGFLNQFLGFIGLGGLRQEWLVDRSIVMYTVSFVDVWKGTGFHMIIFMAGLLAIPRDYGEAAQIDGANPFQEFFRIKLPLMMQAVSVNVVLSLIAGFKVFEQVFVLTNGGPGYASSVLNSIAFQMFGDGRWGLGTAMNLILFLLITAISFLMLAYFKRKEVDI
ncbi:MULTISPECIES: carbohydrate ABC transporter permease [Cohnella]|uniref:Carbohydrate ABC transporter membrane protein 1 (CUT1 family) n=1 Tax=Cohnella phaseoli TaxID=456490 RepID=A0A3D9KCT8_9BACL|nr:sugar ABC transporter permease [Cohnella phaseoli]RED83950.1 carbohydrate ABC transporter membrane protein 1 (CUT1 family) [Cohnella phaseoli]